MSGPKRLTETVYGNGSIEAFRNWDDRHLILRWGVSPTVDAAAEFRVGNDRLALAPELAVAVAGQDSAHERVPAREAVPLESRAGRALWTMLFAMRPVLNRLLYFPSRAVPPAPGPFQERQFEAPDGTRLHGWWLAGREPAVGHLLLCHGNAGNIADRVPHAALLAAAGFDVMLFDYRGYGRSAGRPDEAGIYRDARAARAALLREPGVSARRLFYLGESLGGAVALELALEHPPAGLVLQSAFTSVRDMARLHYPIVPAGLVPDAYPSLRLIGGLCAPLLVIHGERDHIIPAEHGRALYDAAPEPKQLHVLAHVGHNDLVAEAGEEWAAAVAAVALGTRP